MKTRNALLMGLLGLIAVVGCSDTPQVVDDLAGSLPAADDVQGVLTDIQTEVSDIAAEVESSDASDELRAAWEDLQAEITTAVASVTENGGIDRAALQDEFDEFEAGLDALGDDVSDELQSSWATLRQRLEELTS